MVSSASRLSLSNTRKESVQQRGVAGRVKHGSCECAYGWRVRPSGYLENESILYMEKPQ